MKTQIRVLLALAVLAACGPAIAQSTTTISALPAASTPITGQELLPLVQSGATKKITAAALTVAFQGASAPTLPIAGQLWFNTTTTSWVLSQYDGAQWVTIGTLNTTAHTWTTAGGGGGGTPGKSVVVSNGVLESTLPPQTVTGASKTFATADIQLETRRSNSGSAMTDTFPAAAAAGMVNGARITLNNVDASASDTVTPGSGTTISSCSTVEAARSVTFVYDLASTVWRPTFNTCAGASFTATGSLVPGNFASVASANGKVQDSGLNSSSFAANGTGAVITTSQSPTATEFNQNCKLLTVNATTLTITLPLSTTLQANGGCYWVSNPSAFSVSIAPNAADSINGGSVNTPVTFPANQSAPVTTDGAGHMFVPIPTSGGGTPCTSVALSLQYNNAGSFGCVTGATFSGGTLQLPGFTATGSIDLSGAASRNINMNATSEIDVGGSNRIGFFGGSIFYNANFQSTNSNSGVLLLAAASATVPSYAPNQSSATTGWGAQAAGNMSGIVGGVEITRHVSSGLIMEAGVFTLKGFTVAGLPASPATGSEAYVTDANAACTYGGTATGGGSTVCKMFYNGAWKEN